MEHPAFLGFAALVLIVGLAAKRVTVLVVCIMILIVLTF